MSKILELRNKRANLWEQTKAFLRHNQNIEQITIPMRPGIVPFLLVIIVLHCSSCTPRTGISENWLDEIEAIVYSGTKINIDYFIEEILDDDGELIILKVCEEDGETYLEPIEDDNEFNEIGKIFEGRARKPILHGSESRCQSIKARNVKLDLGDAVKIGFTWI